MLIGAKKSPDEQGFFVLSIQSCLTKPLAQKL
jgi:hypothetical protein